jgi:hypothetical protein
MQVAIRDTADIERQITSIDLVIKQMSQLRIVNNTLQECDLDQKSISNVQFFSWYLVKVPVPYVNFVFERTES